MRDNLEALATEDADAAVAAKTHLGATAGLDYALYDGRVRELQKSVAVRAEAFESHMKELLG